MNFWTVICSDYRNTIGFVVFDGCNKWNPIYLIKVNIGYYLAESDTSEVNYFQVSRRGIKGGLVNVNKIKANLGFRFGSPSNPRRMIAFKFSDNGPDFIHPDLKCREWLIENKYPTPIRTFWGWTRYPQFIVRGWCPRFERNVIFGFFRVHIPNMGHNVRCYSTLVWVFSGLRSVCCYKARLQFRWFFWFFFWFFNMFTHGLDRQVISGPLKGVPATMVTRFNLLTYEGHYKFLGQMMAYRWCCIDSTEYCHTFRYYFPLTFGGLRFRIGGWRGDPHITTLDGLGYTFNGLGQFILLNGTKEDVDAGTTTGFLLTALYQTSVNVTQATMTTGVAMQHSTDNGNNKSTIVEFSLNTERSALHVYIDKRNYTNMTALRSGVDFPGNVNVRFDGEWYIAVMSGSMTLKGKSQKGSLVIDLMVADDYNGTTTGLMGNNNGDKDDDLKSRNQTIALPSNSTDEEIFPIGMTYAINCSDADESLFHYTRAECNSQFNASYRPQFTSSVTSFADNPELKDSAEAVCGTNKDCLFDSAMTKDVSFGNETKTNQENTERTQEVENNAQPTFNNNDTNLELVLGESGSVDVSASDPDVNDSVTLSVDTNVPWITLSGSTLEWRNVSVVTGTLRLSVTAIDTRSMSQTKTFRVQLCQCRNNSTCQWPANATQLYIDVECDCSNGWSGQYCHLDEDGCGNNPCFSSCTDVPASEISENSTGYRCGPCPSGYEGDGENCTDIDECARNASNCAQMCVNTVGSFHCLCRSGFTTINNNCIDIDECRVGNVSCDINSTCHNTIGEYDCQCRPGYFNPPGNPKCIDFDECAANNSICSTHPFSECVNGLGSYRCQCLTGYFRNTTGQCQETNECEPTNECAQQCIDRLGRYECACESGFTLEADGKNCTAVQACTAEEIRHCGGGSCAKHNSDDANCVCPSGYLLSVQDSNSSVCENINECLNSSKHSCRPLGVSVCSDSTPGYSCSCPDGYRLIDRQNCEDRDECFHSTHSCNLTNSNCVNTQGGYFCACNSGYVRDPSNSLSCIDVDECSAEAHNCDKYATCVNTDGSFTCQCKAGYAGNGVTCEDVDECNLETLNTCDPDDGICVNTVGSYLCTCRTGFNKANGSNDCVDINECSSGSTLTGCWNDTMCTNIPGSYRCLCPLGTTLKADRKSCEVTTACPTANRCGSVDCALRDGSQICVCPSGKHFVESKKTCEDIDYCAINGDVLCPSDRHVKCKNIPNSYRCECLYPGKDRQIDPTTCLDIDECANETLVRTVCNNRSMIPTCKNRDNGFDCVCGDQYQPLMKPNGLCQDIDECATNTHRCDPRANCVNINPGYLCRCPAGYTAVGVNCTDIDECSTGTHNCEHHCTNTIGSFVCSCRDGYQVSGGRCLDKDECQLKTAQCTQVCTNTLGSYACSCQEGFLTDPSNALGCVPIDSCSGDHGCSHLCFYANGKNNCRCPNSSYTMLEDQKTCRTIDGGWTEWQASLCSKPCGVGARTYTRKCTKPAPYGSGLHCLYENGVTRGLSEVKVQSCSDKSCELTEKERLHAVYADMDIRPPITRTFFFLNVVGTISSFLADSLNRYCQTKVSECCWQSGTLKRRSNDFLQFVDDADIGYGSDTPIIISSKVTFSVFVTPKEQNALCQDLITSAGRNRRSAAAIGPTSLSKSVFSSVISTANLVNMTTTLNKVLIAHGFSVSYIGNVRVAAASNNLNSTSAAPTATPTTSDSWVIPVSVVLTLLGIGVAVVLTLRFCVFKRKIMTDSFKDDVWTDESHRQCHAGVMDQKRPSAVSLFAARGTDDQEDSRKVNIPLQDTDEGSLFGSQALDFRSFSPIQFVEPLYPEASLSTQPSPEDSYQKTDTFHVDAELMCENPYIDDEEANSESTDVDNEEVKHADDDTTTDLDAMALAETQNQNQSDITNGSFENRLRKSRKQAW